MSKKNPLTPEEIQAIADAVAQRILPYIPRQQYPYNPYPHPYRPTFWWTVNSAGPGNQA